MKLLEVTGLRKVYGRGENEVRALDGVSFSVEKGEFVSVIGASGSGKSTLLHMLGGVDRPTAGSVFIDGADICKMNESSLAVFRRRQIGLIYQFYNLIPTLTVRENITLPLLLDGQQPDMARTNELIETLSLTDCADYMPYRLSGGQQQRASVGRALINDPALLLADEPTGNLDSKNSAAVMELLRRANKERGQTLILITHDRDAALTADRIIELRDGKIIKDEAVF